MKLRGILLATAMMGVAAAAQAASTTMVVHAINDKGMGAVIGTVTFKDTKQGLLIEPKLTDLPPGKHGFHIHAGTSCAPAEQGGKMLPGLAAAGHFDPKKTGKHLGPEGDGHLGDMPVLLVDTNGTASLPGIAPHLTVKAIRKHAVIIHGGGDNYSDQPAALGGGGARIACGIID